MSIDIKTLFDRIASRMRLEFEESREAFAHNGIKGENAEGIVRRFFETHLPRSLDLSSGTIVDSAGGMSRQLDIIISDRQKTPILSAGESARVLPVEPVYAVIEVKSMLTPTMIPGIVENMLSVKRLTKTAYYKSAGHIERTYTLYENEYPIWPVLYFVFAFESSDPVKVCESINTEHSRRGLNHDKRIDSACVLDSAVVLNARHTNQGEIDALPSADSTLIAYPTPKSLLLFYTLITNYLNQADCPTFRFKDYLGQMTF